MARSGLSTRGAEMTSLLGVEYSGLSECLFSGTSGRVGDPRTGVRIPAAVFTSGDGPAGIRGGRLLR